MIVAATTDCFPDLSLPDALAKLTDLEFTNVEIGIRESSKQLTPSQVQENLEAAVGACTRNHRLTTVAYYVDPGNEEEPAYYERFAACCQLAKATRVVTLCVPGAELGTPFNGEIERLRKLVQIASADSLVVAVHTEVGKMTQDPDTVVVLCDNVSGLGVCLDPSHYICGPHAGGNYEQVLKYVRHVHLRDTSKDNFQVRVGQGEIEYGRLTTQLTKYKYTRALSAHITATEGVDHDAELRKIRLLLESLL